MIAKDHCRIVFDNEAGLRLQTVGLQRLHWKNNATAVVGLLAALPEQVPGTLGVASVKAVMSTTDAYKVENRVSGICLIINNSRRHVVRLEFI